MRKGIHSFILCFFCVFLVSACSSSGGSSSAFEGTAPVGSGAAKINLSAAPFSVPSDNSKTSTITATVLNASNAAVKDIVVIFKATGGQIVGCTSTDNSGCSATTDANGTAQVTFSSGTIDRSNRVATITGMASGYSSDVPVSITGSKIELGPLDNTTLTVGSSPSTLQVTALDAGLNPVRNADITLSSSDDGKVTLSPNGGKTDISGILQVEVTGASPGTVTITAEGLGYKTTQNYVVTSPAQAFSISSPTDDPLSLKTGVPYEIVVKAPGLSSVTFVTTIGTLQGDDPPVGPSQLIVRNVLNNEARATFTSSLAGLATVQVYDTDNPSTTDMVGIAVSLPVSAAEKIDPQSSSSAVKPSYGGTKNTVSLVATVRSAGNPGQIVPEVPVAFSIVNPTGGGETIFPVVVYSDGSGVARTTFTSGSLSSGQSSSSVTVKAQIVGMAFSDTANIVINSTAGSVVIGHATVISSDEHSKYYTLPMAVQVADSNGNPVAGTTVSLSAWPINYSTGVWYPDTHWDPIKYFPYVSGSFTNEDINEDVYLEPGEDVNRDGSLTPPNSAAGTLPMTVVTDENGVANFNLVYLKQYAIWITDRVRATTMVQGSETTSSLIFRLPAEQTEAEDGVLNNAYGGSPFYIPLTVVSGGIVIYNLPTFQDRFTDAYSTMLSPASGITNGLYTFDASGVAPGIYDDLITINGKGLTVSRIWIRVFVQ